MAENKTTEERLAEIEAKKEAERKAKQKKKADEAKADAEYKKKLETEAKYAKENMDRASSYSAYKNNGPQAQSGKQSVQDQRIERERKNDAIVKYGTAYNTRETLLEKYGKTGDAKTKQRIIENEVALKAAVAEYIKVFGHAPENYVDSSLSNTSGRSEGQQRQGAKAIPPTAAQTQSRESIRSAGRNAAFGVTPAVVAQSPDPNIQRIIDAAAQGGIQLSLAEATAQANLGNGGGGGGGSLASTQKQTTQYTLQQVRSAADNIYQNSIGRVLNDDELRMLHQSLNNTLKSSPTVVKTDAKGNSTTTGGVDERGFMQQQAEANPEFAAYQKATTYFDAMLGSLQGPVGGGI
jgi:hypothetical protein